MKILKISGKNLASLEGEFSIEFTAEPLLSAGIFAITGATGSGKSTILDTLCLALFAKTPRHILAKENGIEITDNTNNKIQQGDIRNILRKGTSDGFAEVVFVGQDNNTHKANWSVRRARNNVEGSLQSYTVALENLTTNTRFGGTKTEILNETERLIGLSFEQFTRSVLLAQGDFTAFLKADKDAKSSLLEKLTGTDIYSQISTAVFESFREAEQELKELRKQLGDIVLLSDEELNNTQAQKENISKLIAEMHKEKEHLRVEMEWHTKRKMLTEEKQNAELNLIAASKIKEEAAPRINKMLRIEEVQETKNVADTIKNVSELIFKKASALNSGLERIEAMKGELATSIKKQKNNENNLKKAEVSYKNAMPLVDEAKKTDVLIGALKGPLKELVEEMKVLTTKIFQHQSLIKEKEDEFTSLTETLTTINKWQYEHQGRKETAINAPLVTSRLQDASKLLTRQKELSDKINVLKKTILESSHIIQASDLEFKALQSSLLEMTQECAGNSENLVLIPIKELEQNERDHTGVITVLIKTKNCWELLYEHQQKQAKLQNESVALSKKLDIFQSQVSIKKAELKDALIKKEQSEKVLQSARLKTTANVEEMRVQLNDGEPCPVCGSEHHPYTADTKQLNDVLGLLTESANQNYFIYETIFEENIKLGQHIESYTKEQIKLTDELKTLIKKTTDLSQQWGNLIIDKACLSVDAAKRSAWIENKLLEVNEQVKTDRQKTDDYKKQKATIDLQKENISVLEKKVTDLRQILTEKQSLLQLNTQQLNQHADDVNTLTKETENILFELDPLFTDKNWKQEWKQDQAGFIKEIESFKKAWNSNSENAELINKKIIALNIEVTGDKNNLREYKEAEKKLSEKITTYNIEQQKLNSKRSTFFEGKEIESVEKAFKNDIETLVNEHDKSKIIAEALQKECDLTNGSIGQLKEDLELNKEQLDQHETALKEWLKEYNNNRGTGLSEEELHELLSFTPDWINRERVALKEIDNLVLARNTTLVERERVLMDHIQHKASEKSAEELSDQHLKITEDLNKQEHIGKEIEFRLRQHEQNKKNSFVLLNEIDKKTGVYEKWAKLNELIGSADGKKFRQIAQEYTLEVLLGYANSHLANLSIRYYLECITGTLALQIIDRDMGDEIRSVHTLSGGESFLVSLALALGLASLSSNKMQVESLFIDEGFGSLDPLTLSIAMDALERLHNMGRKVGVITHVQEMTERIQTQVKVIKMPGGKSMIEVV